MLSKKFGILSVAIVPLFAKGKVIGALNIASKSRHSFSNMEKEILQSIGIEIGTVISKMQAEQRLKESEKKFRTLFDASNDAIFFHDLKGNFLEVNQTVCERLGYTKEELLQLTPMDIDTPEFASKVPERINELIESGGSLFFESANISKDGKVIPIELSSKIINYQGQKAVLSVSRDITDRKKSEQSLKESEEKYRHLFETSPLSLILLNKKGVYVDCNSGTEKLFGYKREELIGKDFRNLKIVPNDVKPILEKRLNQSFKGKMLESVEFNAYRKDGKKIWINSYTSLVKIGDEYLALIIGQDITQKKIGEQKLLESEDKFRTLFEIAPMAIIVSDLDSNILLHNQKFLEMHGINNPDHLKDRKFTDFIAEKDRPKLAEAVKKTLGGIPRSFNDYTMLKADGTEFQVEATSIGIKDNEGKTIGLIGISQDITERRKAEQLIRSEKERAELYLNLVKVIVVAIDKEGKITMLNKKGHEILGYEEGRLIGKNWFETCLPPHDSARVYEYFKKLMNGEIDVVEVYENYIITKHGQERLIDWSTVLVKDESGNIIGSLGSGVDITERQEAEKKLKESEENFRNITEQSLMGIAILQDDIFKYTNEQFANIYGYSIDQIMSLGEQGYQKLVHPDDLQFVSEQAKKKQLGETEVINQYQFRGIKRTGEIIWVEILSRAISSMKDRQILWL